MPSNYGNFHPELKITIIILDFNLEVKHGKCRPQDPI